MYMAYKINPNLPRLRMQAVELVHQGWSVRKTARHFGFSHNAVLNWLNRKPIRGINYSFVIPTRSSRPHHHPNELPKEIIERILELRRERNQCAEILHHRLLQENILISVSSVKRVLKRYHISRFSQWKKWHQYPARPIAEKPGILVELDSMQEGLPSEHLYVYALIDVCSRWAHATPTYQANSLLSAQFISQAKNMAPFQFKTIQSDHGREFSKWFTKFVEYRGLSHRHSRVRTPTDNAHIERFIRTLQQECLNRTIRTLKSWQKEIPEYLHYYNTERPHMGLKMRTPLEVVRSY